MTTAPHAPPADRIESDAQAIEVATRLAGEFAAGASERDRGRRLPHAELDTYARSGLWGITVPREYGGAAVSRATLAEVVAIISSADGSLGQIPQNHYYAVEIVRVNGSEAQKRRLFGSVLAGERWGNALAELGTRTSSERKTRLTRDGAGDRAGFRVNGRKFYATGALYAQRIPTSVIDDDGVLQLAFIGHDAPGLSIVDDWSGFGQRTTGSGTVVLDDVRVEADDVVPMQASFTRPTTVGPFAQLIHAAIDLGIARAAFADTLRFVRERSRPWVDSGLDKASDDPLTLAEIGTLSVRLQAAEAMLRRAGRAVDAATLESTDDSVAAASVAVAEARALTTGVSLLAGSKLFELAGTQATLAEHNFDRHWRNARTHTLHDPVRWKYRAVGDYVLNDKRPPRHGAL